MVASKAKIRGVGKWLPGAALGLGVALIATPTLAEFQVCNQTLDVVNVAIGQQVGAVFRTEGWWTIGSNQCASVIRDDLQTRFVYVFANDVFGQTILDGTVPLCIAEGRFSIDGIEACWQRGYREAQFVEVDTQDVARWTFFISAPEQ